MTTNTATATVTTSTITAALASLGVLEDPSNAYQLHDVRSLLQAPGKPGTTLARALVRAVLGNKAAAELGAAGCVAAAVAWVEQVDVAQALEDMVVATATEQAEEPKQVRAGHRGPRGNGVCRVVWDMVHRPEGATVAEVHAVLVRRGFRAEDDRKRSANIVFDAVNLWTAKGWTSFEQSLDSGRGGIVYTAGMLAETETMEQELLAA